MVQPQTSHPVRSTALACLIALLFFLGIAPTLNWIEFTGGMETNVVIAGIEAERDGNWLVPTQNGEPRTRKPPLAHWTTGIGLELWPGSREFAARWPSLLCACAMLVACYSLGKTLEDETTGLLAALVCGSTILFLQFSRQASYDVQLAFWVACATAFLARAVVARQWMLGCCGAGVALGLAMLTKGPVALVQTVLPVLTFAVVARALRGTDVKSDSVTTGRPRVTLAVVCGVVLMLIIALPWPVYVMTRQPGLVEEWSRQVTLAGERKAGETSPLLAYLLFVPLLMPWTAWFIAGVVRAHFRHGPEANRRLLFAWMCVIVPIVIMNFVPVRRTRYLLPMLAPAAVLAAAGLRLHLREWGSTQTAHRVMTGLHWFCAALVAVGLPVAGAVGVSGVRRVDGTPWYSAGEAVVFGAGALVVLTAGFLSTRRYKAAFVVAPALVMVALQAFFILGYRHSPSGVCEERRLVDRVLTRYPEALFYNGHPDSRDVPLPVSIYGNRVLKRAPDMRTITPSADHAQVVFCPADTPVPVGFTRIDSERFGKIDWAAYLLTK